MTWATLADELLVSLTREWYGTPVVECVLATLSVIWSLNTYILTLQI
jgi:hypothetical protein